MVWRLVRDDEPRIELVPLTTFGRYEDVQRRVPDNRRPAPCSATCRESRWRRVCPGRSSGSAGHDGGGPAVIHVVVPAYNEAGNIAGMLRGIRERLEPLGVRSRDHRGRRRLDGRDRSAGSTGVTAGAAGGGGRGTPQPRPRSGLQERLPAGAAGRRSARRRAHPRGRPDQRPAHSVPRMLHRVWEEGDHIVLASCYLYGGGIRGTRLVSGGLSHVANASDEEERWACRGWRHSEQLLPGLPGLGAAGAAGALRRRLHHQPGASSAWWRSCTGPLAWGCASPRCRWCSTDPTRGQEQDADPAHLAGLSAARRAGHARAALVMSGEAGTGPRAHPAMIVRTFPVGLLQCNCVILADPETREAIVVDPGDEVERVLAALHAEQLTCKAILNTHTHIDHVGANLALKDATGAPLMLHEADQPLYDQLEQQAQWLGGMLRSAPSLPRGRAHPSRRPDRGGRPRCRGLSHARPHSGEPLLSRRGWRSTAAIGGYALCRRHWPHRPVGRQLRAGAATPSRAACWCSTIARGSFPATAPKPRSERSAVATRFSPAARLDPN